MSKVTLLDGVVKTAQDAGVNENGTFHLFTSPKQNVNAGDNWLEVVVRYEDNTPNPAAGQLAKYNLTCVIETEDDNGTWHPIHYQFQTYVNPEDGQVHILRLDPKVFQLDEGVASSISDGFNNIAIESVKQGVLPDDFRVCILVNEFGYDANGATANSFNEVKLTATFQTLAV